MAIEEFRGKALTGDQVLLVAGIEAAKIVPAKFDGDGAAYWTAVAAAVVRRVREAGVKVDLPGAEKPDRLPVESEVEAFVRAAHESGDEIEVRWWNRCYRGVVTRVADDGFRIVTDHDGEFPDPRWCGWVGTVGAASSYDELPDPQAWKERWPEVAELDAVETVLGPFVRSSETSRQAALAAYPRQGSQRAKVLDALADRDARTVPGRPRGLTRDELAERCGLSPNTIRPRVVELVKGGWLAESSHTRTTVSGREAALVYLTDAATREMATQR